MTLTLELSDETAARAQSLAQARGVDLNTFFTVAVEDAFVSDAEAEEDEPDWEIVAAGREVLEDIRAGRLFTLEEAEAQFEDDFTEARVRVRAQISAGVSPSAALRYA